MSSSRPFMDFLREQRNGATHDELSDALQDLVAAVAEEGKAGRLTLTIAIKPADKGGALLVADEIKVVAPRPVKGSSIFYASPENNLVREDPKQRRLPLQEVRDREAPREIGSPPSSAAGALA